MATNVWLLTVAGAALGDSGGRRHVRPIPAEHRPGGRRPDRPRRGRRHLPQLCAVDADFKDRISLVLGRHREQQAFGVVEHLLLRGKCGGRRAAARASADLPAACNASMRRSAASGSNVAVGL